MDKAGLPKSMRLHKKKEISHLFRSGKVGFKYPLRLHQLPAQGGEKKSKIFIYVPKKSLKKSIDRNRIKRRIREIFRQHIAKGENPLWLACLYIGKKEEIKAGSYQKLKKALLSLIEDMA